MKFKATFSVVVRDKRLTYGADSAVVQDDGVNSAVAVEASGTNLTASLCRLVLVAATWTSRGGVAATGALVSWGAVQLVV